MDSGSLCTDEVMGSPGSKEIKYLAWDENLRWLCEGVCFKNTSGVSPCFTKQGNRPRGIRSLSDPPHWGALKSLGDLNAGPLPPVKGCLLER